jgi:RNA polymerase sigma-70 factor (ECF subfamily)
MNDALRQRARLRVVRSSDASDLPPSAAELAPDQFDALYLRFAPYVASIAIRLLGRDDEVDDLVQDVFVEVLRGLARLREPGAFKGWLAQITVRTATRRLRQRNLRRALHLPEQPLDYEALAAPAATAEQRALLAQVYRVLDSLPARTRVIWILRHVLDEPLHAVAEWSECSQSTVQRRLIEAQAVIDQELSHD